MSARKIVVEGRWAVEGLLSSDLAIEVVVFGEGHHPDLLATVENAGVPHRIVPSGELIETRGYEFHRGVYAIALRPEATEPTDEFLDSATNLVIPIGLADAGNLGNLIRSAAGFGADGVIVGEGRGTDPYYPKSIRASSTGIFRVPLFEVPDLCHFLERAKEGRFLLFGLGLGDRATALSGVRRARKSVLLIGSEEDGLPSEILDLCDEHIRIPMSSGMDSLNAAAAAATAMYELFQRQPDKGS